MAWLSYHHQAIDTQPENRQLGAAFYCAVCSPTATPTTMLPCHTMHVGLNTKAGAPDKMAQSMHSHDDALPGKSPAKQPPTALGLAQLTNLPPNLTT
jgi:hypothetical protein